MADKPEITVRPMLPEDVFFGLDACLSQLRPTELASLPLRQLADLAIARQAGGSLTFVAIDSACGTEGWVVGTCTLALEVKYLRGGSVAARIEDVAVLPKYRRAGLAARLVGAALDEARRRGCYKVELTCRPELAGLYSRHGFRARDVSMRLDLGAGN